MTTAIIFRDRLLAPSETFIFEQARALQRYEAVLAGLRRSPKTLEHDLPEVLLCGSSGIWGKVRANLHQMLPIDLAFRRRLRALHPAILHAHFAMDGVKAMRIAKSLGVPLIVSLHGFDVTSTDDALRGSRSGRQYLIHRQPLFQQASAFLCVSAAVREAALRAGFPANKLHVHYTGIDCERFRPGHIERDPKLILFVGRLVEKKGCEYLLRAMAEVQQQDTGAHLEIIGDGPLRAHLEELARQLGIRVLFRGIQAPSEVQRRMSSARILCNPSVTAQTGDMEGFGMVFAEAQAVGTPIVSTLHGGIREAVNNGETGLLCPEKAVGPLADALLVFLKDDEFWSFAGRRAVNWVQANFNIAKQTAKLEEIYDLAVRQRSPQGKRLYNNDLDLKNEANKILGFPG